MTDNEQDYIEIKAQVFRVIRANSDKLSPRRVMEAINRELPDVDKSVIRQALADLYTTAGN